MTRISIWCLSPVWEESSLDIYGTLVRSYYYHYHHYYYYCCCYCCCYYYYYYYYYCYCLS